VIGRSVRRWSGVLDLALGLIVGLEGVLILIQALSVQPDSHLIAFGAAEVIGALLFIWPRTMRIGACVLVCSFLIAVVVHLLEREFPSEHLVYAVAVLLAVAHGNGGPTPAGQAAG
jgi:hypothetical protein